MRGACEANTCGGGGRGGGGRGGGCVRGGGLTCCRPASARLPDGHNEGCVLACIMLVHTRR